jgi:hypothetical protein
LIDLTKKHPNLLEEITNQLSQLPEPVGTFILQELKHRSHPHDAEELTQPSRENLKSLPSLDQARIRSRTLNQRRPR